MAFETAFRKSASSKEVRTGLNAKLNIPNLDMQKMESPPSSSASDRRLKEILDVVAAMAALDFSKRLVVDFDPEDPLEAVAYGINMLSEELNSNVIERRRLSDINRRLEEFAYTTSHDLKSPLHAVHGLIGILKQELGDDMSKRPEVTKLLDMISGSVNKMREMIDGILEYSRLEDVQSPAVWIETKRELTDLIQMHAQENVNISLETTMPRIWYNKVAFIQIMDNLITNSIKYCRHNGCQIRIRHKADKRHHTFSVTDNGPGIHPDFHERIFELFVTLPHSGGTERSGIGLATVKKLVEKAGGAIRLESEPGEGATFSFTIPLDPESVKR
ncbi:MAG TPA: HAMP domain-containing sensor histidine kinase [Bacteroidia bacterium]|jgi:signal transduction histidine kinase|nr:HAMP domain-containing sensor histidine kinase [Bacteroidia bacterium]